MTAYKQHTKSGLKSEIRVNEGIQSLGVRSVFQKSATSVQNHKTLRGLCSIFEQRKLFLLFKKHTQSVYLVFAPKESSCDKIKEKRNVECSYRKLLRSLQSTQKFRKNVFKAFMNSLAIESVNTFYSFLLSHFSFISAHRLLLTKYILAS